MFILITYDVNTSDANGRKRLRQVAKQCVNYGTRVQNSVFECEIPYAKWLLVKKQLINMIDEEKDSLRIYYLGDHKKAKFEHIGAKVSLDVTKPMIF